ncbi:MULTISPECIES: hypothetical protein [Sphingobacterium]|uniref:hypothetical protein n=1 Tax=Sphingobacterium TaxID=28453 RepID=UPI0013DB05DE|nr:MULTISPECIES: hypothetical protein [unclassified Sphingobacterium]
MKRNTVLNFFDISSDLEILPENELFKIKGGNSDIAWENELDPIDIPPPDDNEDDYPEEEEEEYPYDYEDPFDDEDPDDGSWYGGEGEQDNPPPDEEDKECTCSASLLTNMPKFNIGGFSFVDDTGALSKLTQGVDAMLANPTNFNADFLTRLNNINNILDRVNDLNVKLTIEFGNLIDAGATTSLRDNNELVITLDRTTTTYAEDQVLLGQTVNEAGDLNSNALSLLVHELKHVAQFLDGELDFEIDNNENILKYGIEDEVEAFQFQQMYETSGSPTQTIDQNYIKNMSIPLKDVNGNPILDDNGNSVSVTPYKNLTVGKTCPIHG